MSNYTQLLQTMVRQLSEYNKGAVMLPPVSVNSPVVNVTAAASPSGVISTSAVNVCSSQASASTNIPQGTVQTPPTLSEGRNHLVLHNHRQPERYFYKVKIASEPQQEK